MHKILLAALMILFVSACGSANNVIATVEDATLTEAELDVILDANQTEESAVVAREELTRHLDEWIFWESWINIVAINGTKLTEEHLQLARENFQLNREADPSLPAVDSQYGKLRQRYLAVSHLIADHFLATMDFDALCSSHILTETEAQAQEALTRLNNGEDFAVLALEISVGPSAASGGDLGCVAPATFVPEFVDGASQVDGTGLSAPVESQFGWHVIDVRSFGPIVRGQHTELTSQEITAFVLANSDTAIQELAANLFDRRITVAPRFGMFDPNLGQVVPLEPQ